MNRQQIADLLDSVTRAVKTIQEWNDRESMNEDTRAIAEVLKSRPMTRTEEMNNKPRQLSQRRNREAWCHLLKNLDRFGIAGFVVLMKPRAAIVFGSPDAAKQRAYEMADKFHVGVERYR